MTAHVSAASSLSDWLDQSPLGPSIRALVAQGRVAFVDAAPVSPLDPGGAAPDAPAERVPSGVSGRRRVVP